MTGHVEWYEPKKGYGFISLNDNSSHLYFHKSEFINVDIPNQGDVLNFEISPGEKGLKAVKISK